MECCSSFLRFCIPKKPLPSISTVLFSSICSSSNRKQQRPISQQLCSFLQEIHSLCFGGNQNPHPTGTFSLAGMASVELTESTVVLDYPNSIKNEIERYNSRISMDGKADIQMLSFESTKFRHLRSLYIDSQTLQVSQILDFAVCPEPEFDMPIFCASFFTSANINIVVLDLNPLHDVISQRHYRDKYYKSLIPLGVKYSELLPWGGKLPSESLKFFSPIVIWTRFTSSANNYDVLYSAFMDYFKAWLVLMDQAVVETDAFQIIRNCEAQHRYLTWRAEKDPGHALLKKLIGETQAKVLLDMNGFDFLTEVTSM